MKFVSITEKTLVKCLLPCNLFTNYMCFVCRFTYSGVGYTTAATNLAASDLTFAPEWGSPHGITNLRTVGSGYLMW